MKRIISIALVFIIAATLSSCGGTPEEVPQATTASKYTYSEMSEISHFIEEKISAYNFNVTTSEKEDGLNISISLKRVTAGAKGVFAYALEICSDAIKEAKDTYDFELSEAKIYFVLYDNNFTEDASGFIEFITQDLETGTLTISIKGFSREELTIEEAKEKLYD